MTRAAIARRVRRALSILLSLAGLTAIGGFGWLVAERIGYAGELEWQEGGMLAHARRVLAGEALYVAPTLEYGAFPYPPLFHWCSAALMAGGLDGLVAQRVVSVVSTLVVAFVLARLGQRWSDGLGGALAAALWLASYAVTGAWMDVGRVDTLALACLAIAIERVDRALTRPADGGAEWSGGAPSRDGSNGARSPGSADGAGRTPASDPYRAAARGSEASGAAGHSTEHETGHATDDATARAIGYASRLASVDRPHSNPSSVDTARASILAGLAAAAACLAKQSSLATALALGVGLALADRRSAARYALALGLPLGVVAVWLERASDGWASWYLVDLLAGHAWHRPAVAGFWIELASVWWPLVALGVAGLVARGSTHEPVPRADRLSNGVSLREPEPEPEPEPVLPAPAVRLSPASAPARTSRSSSLAPLSRARMRNAGLVVAALVATAWLGRMHVGGYRNTLLPAVLAFAAIGGPLVARGSRRAASFALVAAALGLAQFATLFYDPRDFVPSKDGEAALSAWVERLTEFDGPVLAPFGALAADRAGHGSSLHAMAWIDILQGRDQEVAARLVRELEEALRAKRFAAIVLGDFSWEEQLAELRQNYGRVPAPSAGFSADALRPPTGADNRPSLLYVPR